MKTEVKICHKSRAGRSFDFSLPRWNSREVCQWGNTNASGISVEIKKKKKKKGLWGRKTRFRYAPKTHFLINGPKLGDRFGWMPNSTVVNLLGSQCYRPYSERIGQVRWRRMRSSWRRKVKATWRWDAARYFPAKPRNETRKMPIEMNGKEKWAGGGGGRQTGE